MVPPGNFIAVFSSLDFGEYGEDKNSFRQGALQK